VTDEKLTHWKSFAIVPWSVFYIWAFDCVKGPNTLNKISLVLLLISLKDSLSPLLIKKNYSIFAVGAKNDSVKRHGWFLWEVNDGDLYHSSKDGFVKPPTHPSTKRAYTPPCNPPTAAKAGIFFASVSFLLLLGSVQLSGGEGGRGGGRGVLFAMQCRLIVWILIRQCVCGLYKAVPSYHNHPAP
jgi:hypothetical protein